jgi:hypothetical protein
MSVNTKIVKPLKGGFLFRWIKNIEFIDLNDVY